MEVWDLYDDYMLYISKLLQIIINALLKLSIKFKRFIPKVVLIFSKMIHYKDLFPENIIAKVEETLALIHYTGISTMLFCGNDL
jgi:hypothetical protein